MADCPQDSGLTKVSHELIHPSLDAIGIEPMTSGEMAGALTNWAKHPNL